MAERHGEAVSLVLVLRGWVKDPVWYSVKCLPFLYTGLCKNLMTHLPDQPQSQSALSPLINGRTKAPMWKAADVDNTGAEG